MLTAKFEAWASVVALRDRCRLRSVHPQPALVFAATGLLAFIVTS